MTMPPSLLVTGGWFWNKGAEAMLRTVQSGILDQVPGARGLLYGPRHESVAPEVLRGLQLWSLSPRRRLQLGLLARWGYLSTPLGRRARTRLRHELGLDAVIDISGYKCGDPWQRPLEWSRARFLPSLKRALGSSLVGDIWAIYEALGLPVFHLPQAWGPFENPLSRRTAERVVRGAARVYARDAVSYEWLRSLDSFSEDKVRRASDIAFAFVGAPAEVGREQLSRLGVQPGTAPLVGIVPNMRIYERAEGEGPQNAYVRSLLTIARWFAREQGCQTILMPHEIIPERLPGRDDRFLCRLVREGCADLPNVFAVTADHSAEELKAMIGETDLLVSSRFHSLIAALSLRRPVVALAWSHKYHELLGGVDLAEFVLPHGAGTEELLALCQKAWGARADMVQRLTRHVPTHEASAAGVLREVTEMMTRGL